MATIMLLPRRRKEKKLELEEATMATMSKKFSFTFFLQSFPSILFYL